MVDNGGTFYTSRQSNRQLANPLSRATPVPEPPNPAPEVLQVFKAAPLIFLLEAQCLVVSVEADGSAAQSLSSGFR